MEIYRPGMGKFSSQTLKSGETSKNSRSNSPEAQQQAEPDVTSSKAETGSKDEKQQQKRSANFRGQQQVNLEKKNRTTVTQFFNYSNDLNTGLVQYLDYRKWSNW